MLEKAIVSLLKLWETMPFCTEQDGLPGFREDLELSGWPVSVRNDMLCAVIDQIKESDGRVIGIVPHGFQNPTVAFSSIFPSHCSYFDVDTLF